MFDLIKDTVIKLLGFLMPYTIRWWFTPAKIAQKVKVQIAPEGSGVEFWGAGLPYVQLWLVVTNMSPFTLTVDRLFGSITFGAQIGMFQHLQNYLVKPSTEIRCMLRVDLSDSQNRYIDQNQRQIDNVTVNLQGLVLCSVNSFDLQRHLQTTHFKLYNYSKPTPV